MEFTVNVNLNASPELVEVVNKVVAAFGGVKTEKIDYGKINADAAEAQQEQWGKEKQYAQNIKKDDAPTEEAVAQAKAVLEEKPAPRKRRTQAEIAAEQTPTAPEPIVEIVVEETPKAPKAGQEENDFVPSIEKLREIAIPLNKEGKNVKGLIDATGYKGLTDIATNGTPTAIKSFYAELLALKTEK